MSPARDSTDSLPVLLARRARQASDRRLAVDSGAGVLLSALAIAWRPTGWVQLLCAAICLGAYGAWGIADRELLEERPAGSLTSRLLHAGRTAAAALGAAAAIGFALSILALTLGTWIS